MAAQRNDYELDQARVALFQVDPGWYEAYWYDSPQRPRRRRRHHTIRRLLARLGTIVRALPPTGLMAPSRRV